MKSEEEDFDSEEFHRDFYGKLVDAAQSGRSPEDAWHLIGKYVDWVEQSTSSSPVVKYIADFLGGLLEVRGRAEDKNPSKADLADALGLLGIVQGRGQPATSLDQVRRRLAAVMLLMRPAREGGQGLSITEARDVRQRQRGDGMWRLRDLQSKHPDVWAELAELPTDQLRALVDGDGSEKSLISH